MAAHRGIGWVGLEHWRRLGSWLQLSRHHNPQMCWQLQTIVQIFFGVCQQRWRTNSPNSPTSVVKPPNSIRNAGSQPDRLG
jgi:hypothetical protein